MGHRLAKAMVKTKVELMERARSVLRSMQKRADLHRSFFGETHVAYINANVAWFFEFLVAFMRIRRRRSKRKTEHASY
jgi:hypothetical protein